ncbi:MAG: hypothetical protein R2849_09355 [Thermomicrobiales bacterium]
MQATEALAAVAARAAEPNAARTASVPDLARRQSGYDHPPGLELGVGSRNVEPAFPLKDASARAAFSKPSSSPSTIVAPAVQSCPSGGTVTTIVSTSMSPAALK